MNRWFVAPILLSLFWAAIQWKVGQHIPTRLRPRSAPNSDFGLVPATNDNRSASAHGVDFVFVHGLGSNPDTTWKAKTACPITNASADIPAKTDCFATWVIDFLPEDVPPEVYNSTRLFFYNYDSYYWRDAVQTRLSNIGTSFLEHVESSIRRDEDERSRKLIFIGHSYGGLVIKEALCQARGSRTRSRILDSTSAIFFLGTPHLGSSASKLGVVLTTVNRLLGLSSSSATLLEIQLYSDLLLDLHRRFVETIPGTVQVLNFFEQRPMPVIHESIPWKEFCVPEHSATYAGHNVKNIGLPETHTGMNKFSSRTESYRIILGKLLGIITSMNLKARQYYSVPFTTSPSYIQRHNLSAELEAKLQVRYEKGRVPHAVAIHGLGGTGKSQLAMDYVEKHRSRYNPILWIDARDEESIRASIGRCASELQLIVDQTGNADSELRESNHLQAVLRWLRSRKESDDEWLVVIDNADDFSRGIKDIIPDGSRGSVIITSRDKLSSEVLPGGCQQLWVEVMSPIEARNLLLWSFDADGEPFSHTVQEAAANISQLLGYLPLAIDIAGSYLGRQEDPKKALKQYIKDYEKHQDDLLQRTDFRLLSNSEKTVWTVWDTTLKKIEEFESRDAPTLFLTFLAHFKGGIIPQDMFQLASVGMPSTQQRLHDLALPLPSWFRDVLLVDGGEWDDYNYRKLRDILLRYHFLQPVQGELPGVTMHSLVRWRAMKQFEDYPWRRWYLLFILASCSQVSRESTTPLFRKQMMTQFPDRDELSLKDWNCSEHDRIFVWGLIGHIYDLEGRWREAEELGIQVTETRKRVLGAEDPDTLTSMNNLASTYRDQGRWKEAEELEVQVMDTRKRVFGAEHPDTLTSMNNLASTYINQGRWKEAEELHEQVMKASLRMLGAEHPNTLTSMANLAATFWNQGRFKESEELFIEVVETFRRVLGAGHASTLTGMANLALTYKNQGRWKEAEALGVQVIETRKKVLGAEHPETLTSMANLALTYMDQDRLKEAEELGVQVMKTRKKVLGAEHPDSLTSMANLALTYKNQGRWKEAEALGVQVIETRKKVLGAEHPETLTSTANLAATLWNQGRLKEAEELFIEVMETFRRVLGAGHPSTLTSMANLAATYKNQGRWKEAEELEIQAMETSMRVFGAEHPFTLTSMNNLASTFWYQGRWKEAEELQVQVMEKSKKVFGVEHPDTLTSMANLAFTWKAQGRDTKAIGLIRECARLRMRILGPSHPNSIYSSTTLADWEAEQQGTHPVKERREEEDTEISG